MLLNINIYDNIDKICNYISNEKFLHKAKITDNGNELKVMKK